MTNIFISYPNKGKCEAKISTVYLFCARELSQFLVLAMGVLNFMGPKFFCHGYFVSSKFFLVGILWAQNVFSWEFCGFFVGNFFSWVQNFVGLKLFSWALRRSKVFSCGYFVGPKFILQFNESLVSLLEKQQTFFKSLFHTLNTHEKKLWTHEDTMA